MLPKTFDRSWSYALLAFAAAAPLSMFAAGAKADVTISSGATQNMSCSSGVCAPTAASAVLNAGDLETMLASGNVKVTTTGSGVQADNIAVDATFSWSATSALNLDAYQSVAIAQAVAVQGQGGLALTTDDGGTNGTLAFGHKGSVTFANLSSSLVINGTSYALFNTIKSLASAIAGNPSGAYALASNFDASQDGTYTTVPIPTTFTGTFEGLGNDLSNLTINDPNDGFVGLFAEIDAGGTLRDLAVTNANVTGDGYQAGVVIGANNGLVVNAAATGVVANSSGDAGGLAGVNDTGALVISRANVAVSSNQCAGGLAGANGGTISQSFATGKAASSEGSGGLVWVNSGGMIENSYSTGAAVGRRGGAVGGLEGDNGDHGTTSYSYSTGKVKGGGKGERGGFAGYDLISGDIADSYWNTDKSGFENLHHGAGNIKNDGGITGLTTKEMQSGLPAGFDPSIWAENKKINGGLPYLLANPPR